MNPLVAALIITGIGMGLVFVVIVMLWGFMALLVRVTSEKKPVAVVETAENDDSYAEPAVIETAPVVDHSHSLKMRAAAAAVAAAISLPKKAAHALPPSVSVSHWQSAGRASNMSERASLFARKITR